MSGNHLEFHVKDTTLHLTAFRQWECRGDCCLQMLSGMVATWPELFEGRGGCLYYGDSPPPDERATKELNFCTTIRAGNPGPWLPFPCFTSMRWPQIGVHDSEILLEELLTDARDWTSDKIFWIGTDQHASRRALYELGKRHPRMLDVELMAWDRTNPQALVSKSRQVSISDHRDFKYLIDCQGIGYSARLKWLLASGRPVFLVARDIVEAWQMEMTPWVHFIPVAADLSNLLEHHARVESDPGLYEQIGNNARDFVINRLQVDAQLYHVAEKLRELVLGTTSLHKPSDPSLELSWK